MAPAARGGDGIGFGGHVVAHSVLAAAARFAAGRAPHALHTTFLRAVTPDDLVRYTPHVLRAA